MESTGPIDPDRTVSVLAYEGMTLFETGIATEVFGLSWPDLDLPWYSLRLCAEDPGRPLSVVGGATLQTPHGLADLASAKTVIVPSVQNPDADVSPAVVEALRQAHEAGARMVSICSGAFALAAAGLLDGRRATTHWRYAERLRRRYPRVLVDPAPLYVADGPVYSSAGCAAGLDLCLHLVREDFGAATANAIARRLIVPPHRDGGQAQYVEAAVGAVDDGGMSASMAWALEHLAEPITLDRLAAQAHLSSRTYLRAFRRVTGTTPISWLIAQRVHASLSLLETTSGSIEEISAAVGFETATTFRHHFAAALHTSPTAYRRTFAAREAQRAVGAAM